MPYATASCDVAVRRCGASYPCDGFVAGQRGCVASRRISSQCPEWRRIACPGLEDRAACDAPLPVNSSGLLRGAVVSLLPGNGRNQGQVQKPCLESIRSTADIENQLPRTHTRSTL